MAEGDRLRHLQMGEAGHDHVHVPVGQVGEIVYRAPTLMAGYWGKPQATAESFAGGWFHSGDLGVLDDEGYLTVVDRIKDMIKTGGATIAALANAAGTSKITIAAQSLALGGANLAGITSTASLATNTASSAQAMIATVNTAIGKVSTALAKLGTGSKALDLHLSFIMKLQDTLDNGVGNLVDADLAKESAKLQSLQTRQQLGVQALSIANTSTSALLGLFR